MNYGLIMNGLWVREVRADLPTPMRKLNRKDVDMIARLLAVLRHAAMVFFLAVL